jgi:hypothetical protein
VARSILGLSLLDGHPAHADESLDACGAAAVNGQKLRRDGKLREAKSWFEVCSRSSCRDDIVHDCRTWRDEVDRLLPAIVIRARDEQGRLVTDAHVIIDGSPAPPGPLFQSIPLEAGPHTVDVERPGSSPISKAIVLREGEHADVSVVFASTRRPEPPRDERHVPAAAYVSGAIAVAGLVGFGALAGIGYADWSRSGCSVRCIHSDAERVRTELLVADVSLVVGAIAAGVATWLYLTRPDQRANLTIAAP